MNNVIEDVLSILDYIVFRKDNNIYKKYTDKQYDYGIEYTSSIDITIVPRTIVIFTDNIKENYSDKVLKFYIELLYRVNQSINKHKIPVLENSNVGKITCMGRNKTISIVRGVTLYPMRGTDYEIWIYVDELPKSEGQFTVAEYSSSIIPYRIVIGRSTKLNADLNEDLSVCIRLND